MHRLPPQNSELREMFDITDLVAIGTKERTPVTIKEARFSARETFARDKKRAIKRINFIALRANDDLVLISIGRRGGIQYHWNFTERS